MCMCSTTACFVAAACMTKLLALQQDSVSHQVAACSAVNGIR
jgi:hypothetical protein